MSNFGIRSDLRGTPSLAAVTTAGTATMRDVTGAFRPPAELPLVAFRKQIPTSYFFATYVWAPF